MTKIDKQYNELSCVVDEQQKITSIDTCVEHRFDDSNDTTEIFEYIQRNETRYTPYIEELKSGAVKIKNSEIANNIFGDLYGKFKDKFDTVDIFSIIIDYFGFNEKEYFQKLIKTYRIKLVEDLSKRTDLGDFGVS